MCHKEGEEEAGKGGEVKRENGMYNVRMIQALKDLHLAPHAPFIPLDIVLPNDIQRDVCLQ
jgi:hypothetical protein